MTTKPRKPTKNVLARLVPVGARCFQCRRVLTSFYSAEDDPGWVCRPCWLTRGKLAQNRREETR
jgi:hypothetical protein